MEEKNIVCPDCGGLCVWPIGGELVFVPCPTCDGKGYLVEMEGD